MLKLKLTEVLESFNPSELKRLGDFVRSPFYNKNKNLIRLYDFFKKEFAKDDRSDITKEKIWKYLNQGKKYNDSYLRSLFSDFKELCEEFLIVTMQERNQIAKRNLLLEALSERDLARNFEITAREQNVSMSDEFNKGYEFYTDKIGFERTLIDRSGRNIEKNIDNHYYRLSDAVDHVFLSSKLDVINSLLSRKYHVLGNIAPDIKFTDVVINHIEENIAEIKKEHPVIYTEYLTIKMMTGEETDRYFNELHSFVIKNISRMNQARLEEVYFPLINYGFNKVALGENSFLNKIFKIYETFEKNGFYSEMKSIQDIDFISIVIAGLRLNKVAWIESFADKYGNKLALSVKEDCMNLVNALIYQQKKNYDAAISSLDKVNYKNSYYYMKSKETLIKIYYETDETEILESLIDSTTHYLKRRKDILSIHYDRYMKFLKYLKRLIKAVDGDDYDKLLLKKDLSGDVNVIGKEWLLLQLKIKD